MLILLCPPKTTENAQFSRGVPRDDMREVFRMTSGAQKRRHGRYTHGLRGANRYLCAPERRTTGEISHPQNEHNFIRVVIGREHFPYGNTRFAKALLDALHAAVCCVARSEVTQSWLRNTVPSPRIRYARFPTHLPWTFPSVRRVVEFVWGSPDGGYNVPVPHQTHPPTPQTPPTTPQVAVDVTHVKPPAKTSRSFVSDHFRALMLACLALLVMVSVVSTGVLRGSVSQLRLEDVHTNDRCVVYTYFEDQGMGHGGTVDVWKSIWSAAGWKPVVLLEQHAALHPDYQDMKDRFSTYPTTNPLGYETACYLRYLAVAVVGGGYMTDYDTININVPPPPGCEFLPNDGKLTTHDDFVPAMVSGTEQEFDRVIHDMFNANLDETMTTVGQQMVSDMYFLQYFAIKGTIALAHNFYSSPNWMADPPCDDNGDELPLMFHLNTDKVRNEFGGADKPAVMNEWFAALNDRRNRCNPVTAATPEEYAQKFLVPLGTNKFIESLWMHWDCVHSGCTPTEKQQAQEELIKSAVDKDGNPVTLVRLGRQFEFEGTLGRRERRVREEDLHKLW